MRAKDVKTPEEIFDYISNTGPDEFQEGLDGLYRYYKYATQEQRAVIEQWVLEDWDRVQDDFISEEEGTYTVFEALSLYEHFYYDNRKYCKISETQGYQVFVGEVVSFDKDTEIVVDWQ